MDKNWEYWDKLEKIPSSGIKLVRGSIVDVCERRTNDAKKAALGAVKRRLNTYVPELHGILTGFRRLKISSCVYLSVTGGIQYELKGKYYVFDPPVDLELEGRIVQKDTSSLSCLVHDLFPVDVQKPQSLAKKDWVQLRADDIVKFRVTRVFADETEHRITGELLISRDTCDTDSVTSTQSTTEQKSELGSSLTEQAHNFCRMLQETIAQAPIVGSAMERPKAKQKNKSSSARRSLDDMVFDILQNFSSDNEKGERTTNSKKLNKNEGSLDEMMGKLLDKVTREKKTANGEQRDGRKAPKKRRVKEDVPLEQLRSDILQNVLLEKQPSAERKESPKKRSSSGPSLDERVMELLDSFVSEKEGNHASKKKQRKKETASTLKGKVKLNFSKSKRS